MLDAGLRLRIVLILNTFTLKTVCMSLRGGYLTKKELS